MLFIIGTASFRCFSQTVDDPGKTAAFAPDSIMTPPPVVEITPAEISDSDPAPAVVAEDQSHSVYEKALDAVQLGDRFLILIYDPEHDWCCYDSNPFQISATVDDYEIELNKRFVILPVNPDNKRILTKFGIRKSPTMIILSSRERVIYSLQNKDIESSMHSVFGNDLYDPEKLYDVLKNF